MTLILGSVFLAGAVLSAVLPMALLICMVAWYWRSVRRVPTSLTLGGHQEPAAQAPAAQPPPQAPPPAQAPLAQAPAAQVLPPEEPPGRADSSADGA